MAGVGAQAPEAEPNVNVATTSWGWTADRGWFQLPQDVVEVQADGIRVWRHDNQAWMMVETLPDAPAQPAGAQASWYGWNYRDDRNKDKMETFQSGMENPCAALRTFARLTCGWQLQELNHGNKECGYWRS